MGLPCGRGWLDLQRYVFRAANDLGYYQVAAAIRAEVMGGARSGAWRSKRMASAGSQTSSVPSAMSHWTTVLPVWTA